MSQETEYYAVVPYAALAPFTRERHALPGSHYFVEEGTIGAYSSQEFAKQVVRKMNPDAKSALKIVPVKIPMIDNFFDVSAPAGMCGPKLFGLLNSYFKDTAGIDLNAALDEAEQGGKKPGCNRDFYDRVTSLVHACVHHNEADWNALDESYQSPALKLLRPAIEGAISPVAQTAPGSTLFRVMQVGLAKRELIAAPQQEGFNDWLSRNGVEGVFSRTPKNELKISVLDGQALRTRTWSHSTPESAPSY